MADDRYYSNTDEAQRFQPGTTVEAGQVDQKFDEVTAGFQAVAADTDRSLKLPGVSGTSQELNATPLQRRRRVVGFDADGNLTLLTGFNWREDWATATEYFVNDVFRDPVTKNIYVTVTRHTSAAALSTDITAARVELAINVEDVELLKQQAANSANAAQLSANASAESASDAAAAQAAAESIANFKGEYGTLSGPLSMPATVLYESGFWVLLNDLADVTASVPGPDNPDWQLAQGTVRVKTTPIGAPDWPCTLTYDENGNLTQAIYSQNNARFRETITYTGGDISSVLYEQSADSGATWSVIGTETLVYTGGKLTSTTWTEGA